MFKSAGRVHHVVVRFWVATSVRSISESRNVSHPLKSATPCFHIFLVWICLNRLRDRPWRSAWTGLPLPKPKQADAIAPQLGLGNGKPAFKFEVLRIGTFWGCAVESSAPCGTIWFNKAVCNLRFSWQKQQLHVGFLNLKVFGCDSQPLLIAAATVTANTSRHFTHRCPKWGLVGTRMMKVESSGFKFTVAGGRSWSWFGWFGDLPGPLFDHLWPNLDFVRIPAGHKSAPSRMLWSCWCSLWKILKAKR